MSGISTQMRTAQAALSTTASLVIAANAGRQFCEVKNLDASINIFIGEADVTSATGHRVEPGISFGFEAFSGPVYAVAASGTPSVSIIEY